MREVHLAAVEHDGQVSVLKHSWAEAAQKADVIKDEEAARTGVDRRHRRRPTTSAPTRRRRWTHI